MPNWGPQGPLVPFVNLSTRTVGWVTGPLSVNRTFSRFGLSGTDLGISWDNGSGQTLMAFGDTFGNCNTGGQQWRHNVLLCTDDDRLADGIRVPDGVAGDVHSGSVIAAGQPDFAQELIPAVGVDYIEVTTIPTAAIAIERPGGGFRQYINYMSVRSWGTAGNWVTNFSAIAYSDNNGQTWTTDQSTIRVNSPLTVPLPPPFPEVQYNNGKFQQSAYTRGRPTTRPNASTSTNSALPTADSVRASSLGSNPRTSCRWIATSTGTVRRGSMTSPRSRTTALPSSCPHRSPNYRCRGVPI